MTDLKSEAGEIARAVRAAAREHDLIDVYMDPCGNVYVQPPGAQFVGRYDNEATARTIAADIHHLLKELT